MDNLKYNKKEIFQIIRESGEIALSYQKKIDLQTEDKSDGTIVTEGDLAVSEFLIEKLSKFYPVLSEEEYDLDLLKSGNTFFVIDPIDGTVSYSKKEDTWTMLVCLVKNNEPVFSVIYKANIDKLYYAEKGKGSFTVYNDCETKILVKPKGQRLLISPDYKQEDVELIKEFDSISHQYGCALKVLDIIDGKGEIYPISNRTFGVWDLVAPYLIIREAGGSFVFLDGYKFNLKEKIINQRWVASSIKDIQQLLN